jgi:hypothetical protein
MEYFIFEKQLITEDWCWQIFFDAQHQLLEINWLDQAKLQDDAFKIYLENWCVLIETYKPTSFFVDSSKGHIIMTPDIQVWHDTIIVPRYINAGVKKIAFLVSEDIFEMTSIEQAFDEKNATSNLKTRFFDDAEEAKQWLIS